MALLIIYKSELKPPITGRAPPCMVVMKFNVTSKCLPTTDSMIIKHSKSPNRKNITRYIFHGFSYPPKKSLWCVTFLLFFPGDSSRDFFGYGEFTWPFWERLVKVTSNDLVSKGHGLNHLVVQLMVNCRFGLVVWIPGIPLWKGLLLGCTPRIVELSNFRQKSKKSIQVSMHGQGACFLSHGHVFSSWPSLFEKTTGVLSAKRGDEYVGHPQTKRWRSKRKGCFFSSPTIFSGGMR